MKAQRLTLRSHSIRGRSHGFSLVELAVVLVIVGVVGALLWRVLPQWRPAAEGDPIARDLILAEQAIQGFVLSSHRLPCPDTSVGGDGLEECGSGVAVGRVPARTLGLPATFGQMRYGVHRGGGADLAIAASRQVPLMPPVSPPDPDPDAPPAPQPVAPDLYLTNGLDFCVALRQAQAAGAGFSVGGGTAAFALAHPGLDDRDGDGDLFDAANPGSGFGLPGAPTDATYDDRTLAVGIGELAVRLGCLQRLGIANGAARAAFAAYDEDRFAAMYVNYRNLAFDVRKTNTTIAKSAFSLAIATLTLTIATQASTIALASIVPEGIGPGDIIGAAASVTGATAAVATAALGVESAQEAESKARRQFIASQTFKVRTASLLLAARLRAHSLDSAGLQP